MLAHDTCDSTILTSIMLESPGPYKYEMDYFPNDLLTMATHTNVFSLTTSQATIPILT
jgi:hypothetical protein